jgi:hypothetical protein
MTLALIASVILLQAQDPRRGWEQAAKQIRRLPPSAFPNLPRTVAGELVKRGCTIPQVYSDPKPHNVISGNFAKKGQKDWAVLCSRAGVSSILLFWGGSAKDVEEIATSPDVDWLQGTGDFEIGYSRSISPVGKDYIIEHYQAYGGAKPPPIDHQGIDHGFVEKASVVLYHYRGEWLKLQGAD